MGRGVSHDLYCADTQQAGDRSTLPVSELDNFRSEVLNYCQPLRLEEIGTTREVLRCIHLQMVCSSSSAAFAYVDSAKISTQVPHTAPMKRLPT